MNSQKSDERYEIFRNCFSRDSNDIAAEFYQNSQLLKKRKNGNYLYHEILSITVEQGIDRKYAKESLRELALDYIEERGSKNMVYGCLHDDHEDHIHYHLMISANEKGSSTRHWITSKQLDGIKRELETKCLEKFPELKQREIMTATRAEKKLSRKAAEMKRQGKKQDRKENVRRMIFEAMIHTNGLDEFASKLEAQNARYYQRGKNHGLEVQHPDGKVEKFRFSTLGVHEEFESYLATTNEFKAAREPEKDAQHAHEHHDEREKETHKDTKQEDIRDKAKTERETPEPFSRTMEAENVSQENAGAETKETQQTKSKQTSQQERENDDMQHKPQSGNPTPPSPERREELDKGYVTPDPSRDLLSHEEWGKQDTFTHKWAQSWRRTIDDLRGRKVPDHDNNKSREKDEPDNER